MSDPALNPWLIAAAAVIGIALVVGGQKLLPRYEWRPVADGRAIVVYDKWSGRFQRTEWDDAGKPHLSDVYTAP
jgi:hypothetical protein